MTDSYPAILAKWVEAQEKKKEGKATRLDKHTVAFLAVRTDVEAAMLAGFSMKTIWENMRETGKLTCRYETFTKQVGRYLPFAKTTQPPSTPTQPPLPTVAPANELPQPKPPKPIGAFTFNSTPDKKDLF